MNDGEQAAYTALIERVKATTLVKVLEATKQAVDTDHVADVTEGERGMALLIGTVDGLATALGTILARVQHTIMFEGDGPADEKYRFGVAVRMYDRVLEQMEYGRVKEIVVSLGDNGR